MLCVTVLFFSCKLSTHTHTQYHKLLHTSINLTSSHANTQACSRYKIIYFYGEPMHNNNNKQEIF